jgi:lipoprotein signal peptidase
MSKYKKEGTYMFFVIFTAISIVSYALSNWLVWQNLKLGTSMPVGGFTGKHGNTIGYGIKLFYFGFIVALIKYEGFIMLASIPIVWFISGWVALKLERKIYMVRIYNDIVGALEEYDESDASLTYALMMVRLPDWWLGLMPQAFRYEHFNIKTTIENYADNNAI